LSNDKKNDKAQSKENKDIDEIRRLVDQLIAKENNKIKKTDEKETNSDHSLTKDKHDSSFIPEKKQESPKEDKKPRKKKSLKMSFSKPKKRLVPGTDKNVKQEKTYEEIIETISDTKDEPTVHEFEEIAQSEEFNKSVQGMEQFISNKEKDKKDLSLDAENLFIPDIQKDSKEVDDEFLDRYSSESDERVENKTSETKSKIKKLLFKSKKVLGKDKEDSSTGVKAMRHSKKHFRIEHHPYVNNDSNTMFSKEKLKIKQPFEKKHLKSKKKRSEKLMGTEKQKEDDFEESNLLIDLNHENIEHVFFDEYEDDCFGGWNPNITDKERKGFMSLLPTDTPKLSPESIINNIDTTNFQKEIVGLSSVKLSDFGFSEDEWEELDFYPLIEPFAYVEILREKESLEKCYFLVEVDLNEDEENTFRFIRETMYTTSVNSRDFEDKSDDKYFTTFIKNIIKEYNVHVSEESFNKIFYYLKKTSLGLSKIDPLMNDPNIEDISCDGHNVPIFLYHRKFGSLKSNVYFKSEDELSAFIYKLAQKCGKHISIAEPILDATMPDGSRIQMTLSEEITACGSTFTIRKFRSSPFSPPDLIEFNTMSSEMIAYMWIAIENGVNMLFAGGTASGKTTALNALSLFIPPEAKIVSIEETREINLPHSNWIPGVARAGFGQVVSDRTVGQIDMYDLMKAALRQRPEYILVGEIRGREAYVLFQAMATGHATYSTVHADSAHSLIHRLEGKPINIPRVMLQSLDVVSLHVTTKVKNKRARRCKQIIEIIDIDPTTKEILTNEVFRWDPVEDNFVYSGKSYVLERIRSEKDLSRQQITDEIKSRTRLVELMNQSNIREFTGVSTIISKYYDNSVDTLDMLEKGVKNE
jgi:archaeal flagellar protein FlaI